MEPEDIREQNSVHRTRTDSIKPLKNLARSKNTRATHNWSKQHRMRGSILTRRKQAAFLMKEHTTAPWLFTRSIYTETSPGHAKIPLAIPGIFACWLFCVESMNGIIRIARDERRLWLGQPQSSNPSSQAEICTYCTIYSDAQSYCAVLCKVIRRKSAWKYVSKRWICAK